LITDAAWLDLEMVMEILICLLVHVACLENMEYFR
jgi:hypothetical protein